MNKYSYIVLFLLLLNACQSHKAVSDKEIYSLLEICYEDYYLNYDVEVTPLLNEFELLLLNEGHLFDTTGKAYQSLFDTLLVNDYFNLPLKMENFNSVLLYKNPSDIMACATTTFSLDSMAIMELNFSKVMQEINHKIMQEEEVSIHFFFDLYKRRLSEDEIRKPYIKQSVLLLLYRWYFKSKYDRVIQIKESHKIE